MIREQIAVRMNNPDLNSYKLLFTWNKLDVAKNFWIFVWHGYAVGNPCCSGNRMVSS